MSESCITSKKLIYDKTVNKTLNLRLLSFFMFLSLFNSSGIEILKLVGNYSLYAFIVFLVFEILRSPSLYKFNRFHLLFFFYILLCVGRVAITLSGLNLVIQLCTVLLIAIYCSSKSYEYIIEGLFCGLLLAMPFLIADVFCYRIFNSSIIYGNSNMIGMTCFIFTILCFLKHWKSRKLKTFSVLVGLILILLSNTRTALLALFVGMLCCFILKNKSKRFFKCFFALFIALIVLSIYLYVFANDIAVMQKLNEIIGNLTHKSLFSGRNRIWKNIFDSYNKKNILLGYGLTFEVSNLTGENVSAHNQFIQILVQQGIIGLVFFIGTLYYLYVKSFKKNKAFNSCVVIMIVIYNTFEVCLIQTHFSIGMFFWFMMFANSFIRKKY